MCKFLHHPVGIASRCAATAVGKTWQRATRAPGRRYRRILSTPQWPEREKNLETWVVGWWPRESWVVVATAAMEQVLAGYDGPLMLTHLWDSDKTGIRLCYNYKQAAKRLWSSTGLCWCINPLNYCKNTIVSLHLNFVISLCRKFAAF